MRLRSIGILVGVLTLIPAGTAYADPPAAPTTITPTDTVTLPTGDVVLPLPDGRFDVRPGPGREGVTFTSPTAPDGSGDRLLVPADVLDQLGSGGLDPALFNVDAILRGETAGTSSFAPLAGDAQAVTVAFETPSGAITKQKQVNLQDQVTGKVFYLRDQGDGTVAGLVPPGEYSALAYQQTQPSAGTAGFASLTYHRLTVADAPTGFTVEGNDLEELTFTVDRKDAVAHSAEFKLQANLPGIDTGMSYTTILEGDWRIYSTPAEAEGLLFAIRPTLTGPEDEGGQTAYGYHLAYTATGEIPADLSWRVRDRGLAKRVVDYQAQGYKIDFRRNSYGRVDSGHDSAFVVPEFAVRTPQVRTEYYTASPEVEWFHTAQFNAEYPADYIVHYGGHYKTGSARDTWFGAPVGPGLVHERYAFSLNRSGDQLSGITPMFTGPDAAEAGWGLVGVTGVTTLSRDGVEIARKDSRLESQNYYLPAGDSGTYTLAVDATRDVPWTALGTRATATWTFDSASTAEREAVNLSTVSLDASGVENGYARRWVPQVVTLDAHRQGAAAKTTSMTMEVSYDDGVTWKKVSLLRHGDQALGLLVHPAGATFVSVRLSSTDSIGGSFAATTIRSFGLK
ncbi:hypothetical protein [Phytomonospora endophytica]|uniref:Uncharacterized protein n=1 Tax=Phytomonospora endophytica TaxID=714109 RepID=A0A841FFX0_9ACTN|nr:hypothetical protein [Phytomonospora endophytica]MBB6032452.1 hypothetical protein [Phytomonospora endophytica]GIG66401.1 hypothetical protein Pen01_26960 [Phytomonospora endophytica]